MRAWNHLQGARGLAAPLAILVMLLPTIGVTSETFRIEYPEEGTRNWNGVVQGVGAEAHGEKVHVRVYIRTDKDYDQGEAKVSSSGKWRLEKTYSTRGAVNVVYATMVTAKGKVIKKTPEIRVDLRPPLKSVKFELKVTNLAKSYSPVDIVGYFIQGVYSKSLVSVNFDPKFDDLIAGISVDLDVEIDPDRDYEVKPRMADDSAYPLTRKRPGLYEGEVHLQGIGAIISLLTAYAGIPSGSGKGLESILEVTPPVYIKKIVVRGLDGEVHYQREYTELERLFEDLNPESAREGLIVHQ